MTLQFINAPNAAAPYGPYSHAVIAGDFVYLSGHSGRDPATSMVVAGGIRNESMAALKNIEAVLISAGCGLHDVVRTTVYLTRMEEFAEMNSVYETFFPDGYPTRSTIQVAALPLGAHMALDAIAYRKR